MDRRDVPARLDREDSRTDHRAGLSPDRPGRLSPERMYPAGEQGIEVRRVWISDAMTVRVIESGPRDAFTVVLLHGWAGSVYSFAEMIPALADAGYRVIAIDLPGHGLSDKPDDASQYSVRAMADAVGGVLRAGQVGRYAIVAHSMSGAIALEMTVRGGAPKGIVFVGAVGVGRVPLAATMRLFTPAFVVRRLPSLITRPLAGFITRLTFRTSARPTERDVDEYWAPSQFDGFAYALVHCLHRASWHRESRQYLRSFETPALVIAGGRDLIVWGVAHGGRMLPKATVLTVPEAGHLVMQESAATTNPAIVEFIRSIS